MRNNIDCLIFAIFVTLTAYSHFAHCHSHHYHDHDLDLEEEDRELEVFERCGVKTPPEKLVKEIESKLVGFRSKIGKKGIQAAQNSTIPINVYWTMFATSAGAGLISTATVEEQIDVLNNAFSADERQYPECGFQYDYESLPRAPFVFNLVEIIVIRDNRAFNMRGDYSKERRIELRRGTCADLNIFTGGLGNTFGLSSFPWDCNINSSNSSNSNDTIVEDSIQLNYKTLPGGSQEFFNEGDTLVHEVGHWLGLYHTFEGFCNDLDYVADTPAQRAPLLGCSIGADTCSGKGEDPIFNYMGYSDDCCLYQFTEGQVVRMISAGQLFRGLGSNFTSTLQTNTSFTEDCTFPQDGFDYSDCEVDNPCKIGDGRCDIDFITSYNTTECNFDGKDCLECEYPDDGFDYSECLTSSECLIGDGECEELLSTKACNFDGGDCPRDDDDDVFDSFLGSLLDLVSFLMRIYDFLVNLFS